MKRLMVVMVLVLSVLFPTVAHASQFDSYPRIEQNGITYVLFNHWAMVEETADCEDIVIPSSIRNKGLIYFVVAVWDDTFNTMPSLQMVDFQTPYLETVEDFTIFSNPDIKVTVHDESTYDWFNECGVNVTLAK